jgi:hypothetical protein
MQTMLKRIKHIALTSALISLATFGETAIATEEPAFKITLQDGAFEVRDYPGLVAAEVSVGGTRGEASSAGFRLLAGYIFGGNRAKQSIAMTAPVVQAPSESESIAMTAPVVLTGRTGAWTVRFIMPSQYTLDTLPVPNDAQVKLLALPPTRVAVLKFSGLAKEDDVAQKTAELLAMTTAKQLIVTSPVALARYNPPWTLWFLRRNEVMVPVKTIQP